ncbi:hypothetical protein BDW62DRAFT_191382 [Aspergillus aurantiobrunneus]
MWPPDRPAHPMISQLKSAFLAKLPIEIRYHIYELVFGDKIIAFTPGAGSEIRHCLCPTKGEKFHWFSWQLDDCTSWCYCITHDRETISSRIPLLLTCRQIYSEAITLLWSHNPIHIQMMGGPLHFRILSDIQAALAPRDFHAIRSLEISLIHPNISRWAQVLDEEWFSGWNGVWGVIKAIKGLVQIQAWLKIDQAGDPGGNFMTAEQEGIFFAPLMELHHIRDFNVEVTWPENEGSERLLRHAPFRLTRNADPILDKPVMIEELVTYTHQTSDLW